MSLTSTCVPASRAAWGVASMIMVSAGGVDVITTVSLPELAGSGVQVGRIWVGNPGAAVGVAREVQAAARLPSPPTRASRSACRRVIRVVIIHLRYSLRRNRMLVENAGPPHTVFIKRER